MADGPSQPRLTYPLAYCTDGRAAYLTRQKREINVNATECTNQHGLFFLLDMLLCFMMQLSSQCYNVGGLFNIKASFSC